MRTYDEKVADLQQKLKELKKQKKEAHAKQEIVIGKVCVKVFGENLYKMSKKELEDFFLVIKPGKDQ